MNSEDSTTSPKRSRRPMSALRKVMLIGGVLLAVGLFGGFVPYSHSADGTCGSALLSSGPGYEDAHAQTVRADLILAGQFPPAPNCEPLRHKLAEGSLALMALGALALAGGWIANSPAISDRGRAAQR